MSRPTTEMLESAAIAESSIRRQCHLLGIARSGVYRPVPANDDVDLALMRRIDTLFMAWPFPRSILGFAADDDDAARRRDHDQSQAGATIDAADGDRRAGAKTEDDEAGTGPQDRATRFSPTSCATR